MAMRRKLRAMTEEERAELERLSQARTEEHRLVERAKAMLAIYGGESAHHVAQRLQREPDTIYAWLNRFEAQGVAGLRDLPRPGRPAEYDEQQRGECIATARTAPQALGLPFGHWSLDRLVAYIQAHLGIAISRAQLGRVLEAEGLRWYQEQTYFTERPDPQYAQKRGR